MTTLNPFAQPIPQGQSFNTTADQLIKFHRLTFGGYRMVEGEGDGSNTGTGNTGEGEPPAGKQDPPAGSDRTFTQAEVDAMIRRRAERVAAEKYGDYDDLKAKAQRLAEIEAANATELEKATKKAKDEGRLEILSSANEKLVRAEARALAAEAKFKNPNLAVKAIDLKGVKVDDDGNVDSEAVKALLEALAKDEPYLVDDGKGGRPKPDLDQGQNNPPVKPLGADAAPGMARMREAYAATKDKART